MKIENIANSSVLKLRGVGPSLGDKLAKIDIAKIQDLLFHLPLRYQDRTRVTPIGAVQEGSDVVIEGVVRIADIAFGKRRSLVCRIQDGTGTISLRFYYFNAAQKNNFSPGTRIRCYGEVRRGASGFEIYHPEYRRLDEAENNLLEESLTPIYPSTAGITQKTWRKLCGQAIAALKHDDIINYLPINSAAQGTLVEALSYLHNPPPDAPQSHIAEGRHPYQIQLAFEELVAHHLALLKLRQQLQSVAAPSMKSGIKAATRLISELPFELTGAQQRVIEEIGKDLNLSIPMLRLVQGDVGSGKTVVAACAAIQAISCGYQVAVMAPTEILAEQHRHSFSQWFAKSGVVIDTLTGKLKGKRRTAILERIAKGESQLVIGTHALFQADVNFDNLGFIVVDEQHRFGVHQRLALSEKAPPEWGRPHQLIMTATPIPRTLSMVAYADLDCSIIDELPPGRQAINTALIDNQRRSNVIDRVKQACREGRQAYWVCTLIEESEALQCKAAEVTAAELNTALPSVSIGLIHGRMKGAEKEQIMARFKSGEIDLLVATTVIEVGVDVANASLMIVENPERLGLAQLHQLRGRVGRGSEASHCVLLYQSPLSQRAKQRLVTMRESNDGFFIAERDLALRGPGEVLGTRQTGLIQFRIADIQQHAHLLADVKQCALELAADSSTDCSALINRWLGKATDYGVV